MTDGQAALVRSSILHCASSCANETIVVADTETDKSRELRTLGFTELRSRIGMVHNHLVSLIHDLNGAAKR